MALLADLPSQQLEQVLKQCGHNLSAKTSAALRAEPGIRDYQHEITGPR
jgi:hypothetical protein